MIYQSKHAITSFAFMFIYYVYSYMCAGALAQPFPIQGYTAYEGVSGDLFMVPCEYVMDGCVMFCVDCGCYNIFLLFLLHQNRNINFIAVKQRSFRRPYKRLTWADTLPRN